MDSVSEKAYDLLRFLKKVWGRVYCRCRFHSSNFRQTHTLL